MKWIRIRAVARKEFLQIWRDPLSLAMAFFMPAMLLIIFGYAITFDISEIKTIIYDLDKSPLSREFVSMLSESGYFQIIDYVDEGLKIDEYMDSGKAKVAVSIPSDFSKKVRKNLNAKVQVILDGSNSNTATIAQGYISAISENYIRKIKGMRAPPVIDARIRVWYNPELKSRNYIVPGLIAVIMAVIVALLTSLTVAREWERGTMEQLLSTPVKTSELIIGKLIPYFCIGFLDTVFSILMSHLLFQVPLRGSVVLLLSMSCLFLFGGLSQGILISIVARSQILASQMAILSTFLPAFLLSGFMFSISNMPKFLQILTHIVPARYFVSILKGIYMKGSPFHVLMTEAALLAVYGIVVFTLANKKMVKRII
jgi:ABC-2 type transport system permease protein